VIGQGPIGLLVDYVANASGGTVIGFDRHDNRIAFAKEQLHMKHGYNTQQEGFRERFKQHAPDGADVIFEAVGSDASATLALELARPGGRVVILGVYAHDVTVNMMHVVRKELQVMGSWTSIFSVEETMQLMRSHKIATDKIITHRYSFADGPKAFEEALNDKANRIKTVIEL
jgi:threonine dehydrogenase-like Zn-dependent dehydrogenase